VFVCVCVCVFVFVVLCVCGCVGGVGCLCVFLWWLGLCWVGVVVVGGVVGGVVGAQCFEWACGHVGVRALLCNLFCLQFLLLLCCHYNCMCLFSVHDFSPSYQIV